MKKHVLAKEAEKINNVERHLQLTGQRSGISIHLVRVDDEKWDVSNISVKRAFKRVSNLNIDRLVARRKELNDIYDSVSDDNTKLYCICQKPSSGEYVECSVGTGGCNGWVHLKCMGLTEEVIIYFS